MKRRPKNTVPPPPPGPAGVPAAAPAYASMAPAVPPMASPVQDADFIENERFELDAFDIEGLEAIIDAYETAFGSSRRQTFVEYPAGHDHGLEMARCPALDDLQAAMDASGEEECRQAGIFRSLRGRQQCRFFGARAHRQFPSAELV